MRPIGHRAIAIVCLCLLFSCQTLLASFPSSALGEAEAVLVKVSLEKLKADLDFLFKTIEEVHPNMYAYISEEEFTQHRDKLYAQINRSMSASEFYKLAAPVVAKLKNGHTVLLPNLQSFMEYVKRGGKLFPLYISWDGEKAIVSESHSTTKVPMGGTVLAIGNEPAAKVLDRVSHRVAAEFKDRNTTVLNQKSVPLLIWGEYGDIESLPLRIKALDGSVGDYHVEFVTLADFKSAKASKNAGQADYSYRRFGNSDTGLLEFNSFSNLQKFRVFLKGTFTKIQKDGTENLIIDLRKNPGGDGRLGDALIGYLTDKPVQQYDEMRIKLSMQFREKKTGFLKEMARNLPGKAISDLKVLTLKGAELRGKRPKKNSLRHSGRTFVLIGPVTGSSAVALASTIRAMGIARLVGEETGDTTTIYGEGLRFHLPNSSLSLSVACQYIVFTGGKPDGRGIIPDHEVRQSAEDLAKGVDTVLQYVLDIIGRDQDSKKETDARD